MFKGKLSKLCTLKAICNHLISVLIGNSLKIDYQRLSNYLSSFKSTFPWQKAQDIIVAEERKKALSTEILFKKVMFRPENKHSF